MKEYEELVQEQVKKVYRALDDVEKVLSDAKKELAYVHCELKEFLSSSDSDNLSSCS